MTTLPQQEASDQEPFFEDARSLAEKINVAERKWMPHKPAEKCPAVLYGLVLELGTFTSAYDDGDTVPTMRLLTADNTEWSVIAFHGWLAAEFGRKQPRVGDFVALIYLGEGEPKPNESPPHKYKMIVERNPDNPAIAAAVATLTGADEVEPIDDGEPVTDERPDFSDDISF